MNRFRHYVLTAAAAFVVTAFAFPAAAQETAVKSTKVKAKAVKPAAAAPTSEALFALETRGWEGWKNRDPKAFGDLVSDRYVGFGTGGRMDKAANIKAWTSPNCQVASYSLSDERMDMLGPDVAVLTFRAAQDYNCDGKKGPADVWASSAYVREGDKWRNVFYMENPVADPNAPASSAATSALRAPAKAKSDALTEALMAVETKAWDAWKNRDAAAMGNLTTGNFMYVSGEGRMDKAGALRAWSEPKCEGLAYAFSEPRAVQLSKDVALVTYKADVRGTCDGRPTPPSLWVASFNQKDGGTWRNAFYTDSNR
jgi:hypothetical protein